MDAYREIENLIYTYAERIDAGDLEGVAELFRNAAIVAPAHDSCQRGYDEVLAMYRASCRVYPETGTPRTRHVTTNVLIEVNVDSAIARSTFTVFQATESLPLQPIICGRYADQFRCRDDGRWEFSERSMQVDFVGDCSAHLLYDYRSPADKAG
ncbi:nuclear transport factor 2 family protein [Parahaliea aestuarii]|uniref:Nuclear transport factor 2 family protein n=1 Tax=Parahaliea aestuarii TaxID=1852021 RepID=A0A5C9A1G3_9GAMM|nr:nuclear transport factor 2 family protein [Parahaliea aestuarii]TXS94705.1 nuclear transport factor 2 family protein [Parahaliea aestuarii]